MTTPRPAASRAFRRAGFPLLGFIAAAFLWLGACAQGQTYSLGSSSLLEGPTAGSGSVALFVTPATAQWSAQANDSWLHVSSGSLSGAGNANVIFTFDANAGTTRIGSITVAGQTLTVTQAASTYVPAGTVTALVSQFLDHPFDVAVDGSGNVFIADSLNHLVKEWSPATGQFIPIIFSGLDRPCGIALDSAGNIYIADESVNTIRLWTASTQSLSVLVSSGLSAPYGVAVDSAGNVYIADTNNNALKKWTQSTQMVTTLVSKGLNHPNNIAVDGAGNIYIADCNDSAIKEYVAATATLVPLVTSGLNHPSGVAVDGSGNVYIADSLVNNAIKVLTASTGQVTTLVSGLNNPTGVAVDSAGNVYFADSGNNAVKELPRAFVDTTPKSEIANTEPDTLPVVLPSTEDLAPPFAPTSDQSWLTVGTVVDGIVPFSVTANSGAARTAHITVLGQPVAVNQDQAPPPPADLAFSTNPAVYTKGFAIDSNTPSSDNGPVYNYSVSPPLPAGLNVDPITGLITGTPTVLAPQATYTVTASNSGGFTTAALILTVDDVIPSALAYSTNPVTYYTAGLPIASNSPSSGGGPVVSYTVSPPLPAGLSLNPSTGVVTGTPSVISASAIYTVTAANSGGSTTTPLVITVDNGTPVPGAQTQQASTHEPLAIILTATEPITEPIIYTILTPPLHGALKGVAPNVTYTSSPTFTGVDTFTFQAANAGGPSAPATVTIHVFPPVTKYGYYSGHYIGLINGADPAHSGMVSIASVGTGAFTGSFSYGGAVYALKGSFNGQGIYQGTIKTKAGLAVNLTFGLPLGPDVITGTVGNSTLVASSAIYSAAAPASQAGRYTVKISPDPAQTTGATTPQGFGVGTLLVAASGSIAFVGRLADGTTFSRGTSLTRFGVWYLFAPLYAATGPLEGMIEGTIQFEQTPQVSDLDGAVTWIRPALTKQPYLATAFYPSGFNLATHLYGAAYNPKDSLVLTTHSANNTFLATGGSIPSGSLREPATAGKLASTFKVTGASSLSLTVSTANGLITGSFKETPTTLASPVNAIIYQNGPVPSIAGWFTDRPKGGTNESGAVALTSP